jgi:Mg2+ transporter (mgtE)
MSDRESPTVTEPMDSLRELVAAHELDAVQQWLDGNPPHVVADELARMDPMTAAVPFRMLGRDKALAVFEELGPVDQREILDALRGHAFADLIEDMEPDNRARMLHEAPAKVVKRLLAGLSPDERQKTAALLGYPEGSVGRVMTPEVVALPAYLTVAQALEVIRAKGRDAETVYTLPVVGPAREFIGVVELRQLVLAEPDRPVRELTDTQVARVRATDRAEDAARLMQETNLIGLPVVDSESRLLGLFTIDDAVEIIEAADSEDIARQAGSSHWTGHYMYAGVLQLAGARAVWLLLLLVAATLTVNVLQMFQSALEQVTALALFIPLLVGTGGNAGAQAATATVRAIAVGELRPADLPALMWRECRIGALLGVMLAAVGLVVGTITADARIALVVGLSLIVICVWAAIVGATMPMLARQAGIDPAVVSAPLVTTLVDATGLIIYFLIARAVLGV